MEEYEKKRQEKEKKEDEEEEEEKVGLLQDAGLRTWLEGSSGCFSDTRTRRDTSRITNPKL